jgi:hypothetical protein
MKKILTAVVTGLVVALSTSACGADAPPITGKITEKYIEDFTENTIVLTDAEGTNWHFAVEADQWNSVKVGDAFSTDQLDQPADD